MPPTPRPLTAARILLWVMAALLVSIGAVVLISDGVGPLAMSLASIVTILALACAAYAYFLPRTGHITLGIVVTLLVLFAFYHVDRITNGSVGSFIGVGFCVALVVLLLWPSSREALRS